MALIQEFRDQGNFLFRYRSFFPLLLLPLALLLICKNVENQTEIVSKVSIIEWAAIAICLIGLIIRVITVGYTPANTSGRNTAAGQVAETVNSTGIYSTVRHPLYLGNFFMWLGIAVLTENFWFVIAFVMAYWLYYERIMYAEEAFLTDKFGGKYTDWAAKTPAFWPRISQWKGSDLTFSWKKVLKKEKNGLFAIFLLVYIFNLWSQYCALGAVNYFAKPTLFYLAMGTGIYYFVFKIIKKSTTWLDEEGR